MISCIWLTCYFIMAENSWNCIYWFLELFSYLCPILAMVHSSIYGELNIFLKSGPVCCFQDITSKFHILTNWLSSFFGPWFWNVEQIIFNIYLFSLNHIYSHPLSNAVSESAEGTQSFEDVQNDSGHAFFWITPHIWSRHIWSDQIWLAIFGPTQIWYSQIWSNPLLVQPIFGRTKFGWTLIWSGQICSGPLWPVILVKPHST